MRVDRAVGYPVRGSHAESALVAGCSLGFVALGLARLGPVGVLLAVLPTLLFAGYLGRIAERGPGESDGPPSVSPLRSLPACGLRLTVVAFSYLAVPALYTVAVRPLLFDTVGESSGTLDPYVFLVASTSLLAVWGVFGYVLPVALVRVVRTKSLRAGVDPAALRATVSQWAYLVAWTQAALLFGFAVALAGVLLASAVVGGLVAVPVTVYAAYASTYLMSTATATAKR